MAQLDVATKRRDGLIVREPGPSHPAKLDTINDMIRHDSRFGRFLTSPIGKILLGAGVGGLVVAFANVQDPLVFVGGMVVGVIAVFALGQIR